MNAPRPTFTSSTSAPMPSAIFLLRIDAQMSGMLSTVPVTSRSAYSRRSAGAISSVWPISTQPVVRSTRAHLVEREPRAKSGDRFELVERAAGVAEPAAGHHRHDRAARGRQRREDERDLVADAAGRVLVDRRRRRTPTDRAAVPDRTIASVSVDGFVERHAAQHDRHQQRGDLIVGPRSVGRAGDERADRVGVERAAVALLADEIDRAHARAKYSGKP